MVTDDEIDRLREAFMQEMSETHCGNTWYGPNAKVALADHMAMNHLRGHDETPPPKIPERK
jgi:hypothetical protein